MQFSNIQTNDKLRIDGMLDRTNKIITASAIRDASYPATGSSTTAPTGIQQ